MPAPTPSTRWPCYGSVFMDRAAEEQRSTFYTADAAELCASYLLNNISYLVQNKIKSGTYEHVRSTYEHVRSTYEYEFYSSKNILGYSTRNENHAPGTTFSNFGVEVWMGGHGNCCRFATLTGVHQGARISLAKYWVSGKVRS